MPNIGVPELLIVLVIALIVLGPKKLPEVGRSLGKGMREFKDSISGMTDHDDDVDEQTGLPAPEPTPTATASTSSSATSPDKQTT
jgi:sec-independent protein translocase protein TatA